MKTSRHTFQRKHRDCLKSMVQRNVEQNTFKSRNAKSVALIIIGGEIAYGTSNFLMAE